MAASAAPRGRCLTRHAALPQVRKPGERPGIERSVVRGRGGPAPRQDGEVGLGNEEQLTEDPGKCQARRGSGGRLARTGGSDLAEQEARGP